MNNINGIPLIWDHEEEERLFGSLLARNDHSFGSPQITNNLDGVRTQRPINPLHKKHSRQDGIPIKTQEKTSVFEHKAFYNVSFIVFEKGSNMLDYHNKNLPDKNEMLILYEQDSDTNSNLFGSFVLVKMGDGYFKYLRDLKEKKTKIFSHVGQSPKGVIIDNFEKEIEENYRALLKRTKQISKETFLFALETEMRTNSDEGKALKSIFGGIDGIVTSIAEGVETTIEEVKFTKEDYTPVRKEGDYNLADFLEKFVEINQELLEKAVDYAIPDAVEKQLSKSFADFAKGANQLAKENLAPETIRFFEKTYKIFQEIVSFFKETATFYASLVGDTLYLVKAFLMGVVNGLLSTIQMIVSLLGWLLKGNIDKKMTGQFYLEIQSKFEFIEDLIDFVSEEIGKIFFSVKNLIKDFSLEKFKEVLSIFKDKAGKIDRFDVAYFAGIFIFEVILGVVLTIFTVGGAAIVEATNAAEKIAAFLKIFGREALSTATMGVVDILQLLRTLITKFAQACQKGWKGFKRFLENLFKNKIDDVAKSEGKVLDDLSKSITNFDEIYEAKYVRPTGLFEKLSFSLVVKKFGKRGGELFNVVEKEWELLQKTLKFGNDKGRRVLVSGMIDKETGEISKVFSNFTRDEISLGKHLDFIKELHPTLKKRLSEHIKRAGKNGSGLNLDNPEVYQFAWQAMDNAHAEFRALDDILKKIDPKGKLGESAINRILGYNSFLRKSGIQHTCADCFYLTYGVTFIK